MLKQHLLLKKNPKTHDRYWWWIVHGKITRGLPPLKRTKLSKKAQERKDVIQKKLYEANRWCNDWKLQLHWKKLEWVDPKSKPKRVKPFSVSSIFFLYQ